MAANPLLAGLFGSETVKAILLWQVFGQLAGALLEPVITELRQASDDLLPGQTLSPADAVEAVIKGHWTTDEGAAESANSGLNRDRFNKLVETAGEPLAPDVLLSAFRRGFIQQRGLGPNSTSLEQGIYESRIKNKWEPILEQLQWNLPDPGTVIEGWLRAQLDEGKARDYLRQSGIPDEVATLMYKSAGRPPSPDQLLELFHRRIIPLRGLGGDTLSVEQGYYETDLKNKWFDTWTHLGDYLPPPRTVTAMVREGALPDDEALTLFEMEGLAPKLAGQYLAAAHHQKTAASKELAKTDVLDLYMNRMITAAQAKGFLAVLGYSDAPADFELELADFRANKARLQTAYTKVETLFVARRLDALAASNALKALGASQEHVTELLDTWTVLRESSVHTLSAAQWASAAYYGVVSEATAITQIVGLGWQEFDAWALVALRFKDGQTTPQTKPVPPPVTASGK